MNTNRRQPVISVGRPAADGSVFIPINVADLDNNDQVRAKIEFVAGSACNFAGPLRPVLATTA